MRLPVIQGVIDRRILANYRVDPAVLAQQLPAPFRPKVVRGWGMAGICLIRLKQLRPMLAPAALGLSSENAAHRIAVEWDSAAGVQEGVYIKRRDTSSRLAAVAGGRLFPGVHRHARFLVDETADSFHVRMASDDGTTHIEIKTRRADDLPPSSLFASVEEASEFFAAGSLGYSATAQPTRYEGLELRCRDWRVEPLATSVVSSSDFDDPVRFPPGSIEFDHALLMRGVAHQWHGRPAMSCGTFA